MNAERIEKLLQLTETLYKYNKQAEDHYLNVTTTEDYEADFYQVVKPFADKVHSTANEWKDLAIEWVTEYEPEFLSSNQIEDTYDNFFISSVIAFQVRTSKRKLMNTTASISYILNIMIDQLKAST